MNHTPGPWTYELHRDGEVCYIIAADTNKAIAHVFLPSSDAPYDELAPERLANARLMASAPLLLAAARRILAWYPHEVILGSTENSDQGWRDLKALYDAVRKAADGEAEGQW